MAPSIAPLLWRYRQALAARGETRADRLTALSATGYLALWTALGGAVFVAGEMFTSAEIRAPALARAAPVAVGAVVLIAGALQFTAWKARHLARCRSIEAVGALSPWLAIRRGVSLGLHCIASSAGLTAVLLVTGMMDLRAMIVVASAITLERLAPAGDRVAHGIGAVVVGAGLAMIVRAAAFG
jgi:predicted metal-binding membrane protein